MRKKVPVIIILSFLVAFIVPRAAIAGPRDKEFTMLQLAFIDHESVQLQLYKQCLQLYPDEAQTFKEGISQWGEKNYPALTELRLILRDQYMKSGSNVNDADAWISKTSKMMTEGLKAQFAKMPASELQKSCSGQFVEMINSQLNFVDLLDKYRAKMITQKEKEPKTKP
jgi:hypothetical protein